MGNPTPNADRLRAMREAKYIANKAKRTVVTLHGVREGMAEAVARSLAGAERRKARKEAKRG